MFTGITTDIGTIQAVDRRGDLRLRIACGYAADTIALGASISCSGVCLTVVDTGPDWFAVDMSGETEARTAKDLWREDGRLNLERALKLGDELGGHIVTGHVDGIGEVTAVREAGGSKRVEIAAGPDIAPLVAPKGSITLDGVSLTVNEVADMAAGVRFGLNIIPHTASITTFDTIAVGRAVNLEIDVLARYLKRMAQLDGTL